MRSLMHLRILRPAKTVDIASHLCGARHAIHQEFVAPHNRHALFGERMGMPKNKEYRSKCKQKLFAWHKIPE